MAIIFRPAVIPVNGDKNRHAIDEADSVPRIKLARTFAHDGRCNAPRRLWRGRLSVLTAIRMEKNETGGSAYLCRT
jgi:hypothetical protein